MHPSSSLLVKYSRGHGVLGNGVLEACKNLPVGEGRAKGIAYGGGKVCGFWMELRLLTRGDTAAETGQKNGIIFELIHGLGLGHN